MDQMGVGGLAFGRGARGRQAGMSVRTERRDDIERSCSNAPLLFRTKHEFLHAAIYLYTGLKMSGCRLSGKWEYAFKCKRSVSSGLWPAQDTPPCSL